MESSLFYGVFSDERGLKKDHKSSKQGNLKRRNHKITPVVCQAHGTVLIQTRPGSH